MKVTVEILCHVDAALEPSDGSHAVTADVTDHFVCATALGFVIVGILLDSCSHHTNR